jgi:hypothetical protein
MHQGSRCSFPALCCRLEAAAPEQLQRLVDQTYTRVHQVCVALLATAAARFRPWHLC